MLLIRGFLWSLVAAMTMQGFLHADEYGAAVGMIGGLSLTLSVMRESVSESARSMLWGSSYVGLPRVIVQAALRETARHPGIHTVPALRKALEGHSRAWSAFRDEDVRWMLVHADLVGAFLVDPTARPLWTVWQDRLNTSSTEAAAATAAVCRVPSMDPVPCAVLDERARRYAARESRDRRAVDTWDYVLRMRGPITTESWWSATQSHNQNQTFWLAWAQSLAQLHNISVPTDLRLSELRENAIIFAANTTNSWIRQMSISLLEGELIYNCLSHIQAREGRVHELMTAAGVADLNAAHERILNASLRVASTTDKRKVEEWFGEMAGYAWWLGEDIPGLVRRCLGQETGDCARAGPSEIASLMAQMDKRRQILSSWVRCLFVGMWNALPVIAILFAVELVILCVDRRSIPLPLPYEKENRTIVLQLQAPTGQIVAERQMITNA